MLRHFVTRTAPIALGSTLLASTALAGNGVLINEVDADQTGTDAVEFIELYDGGVGNTALDGYVVVLYNGSDDQSYTTSTHDAFDLDGFSTDANGFFVIGADTVANVDFVTGGVGGTNLIQNGADAVALYNGFDDTDFPLDTPITLTNLVDAMVYDTNDSDDPGLAVLVNAGQPQVNEGTNNSAAESNGRCPDGSGGARNTVTYTQGLPTPGAPNACPPEGPQSFCDDSDGALAACPCSNPGLANTGCENAGSTGGVGISAAVFAPDGFGGGNAVLQLDGFPAGGFPTFVVMRSASTGAPTAFGDGVICLTTPVVRVGSGTGVGGSGAASLNHGAGAGAFNYQGWYRSTPASFCDAAAAYNMSNGIVLDW